MNGILKDELQTQGRYSNILAKALFPLLLLGVVSCDTERYTTLQEEAKSGYAVTGKQAVNTNIITGYERVFEGSDKVTIRNLNSSDKNLSYLLDGLVVKLDLNSMTAEFLNEKEEGYIKFDLVKGKDGVLTLIQTDMYYPETNKKVPRWLCAAGCVATGFGISLWDGPAPLMDIAAAAYTYSCAKSC